MFELHEIDKVPEFSHFFITKGKHVSLQKLVYMLFLLDVMHFFEIGRIATNLTYKLNRDSITLPPMKEKELEFILDKESPKGVTKNVAKFASKLADEFNFKKFTKRESRILQKIIAKWDSATPTEFFANLSKTFKIMKDEEGHVSFKDTLEITNNDVYRDLKHIIEEREDFVRKRNLNPEKTPPDAGFRKCNQGKL